MMNSDDLEPGMDRDELAALGAIGDRLEQARPSSAPEFKRRLGRSVRIQAKRRQVRHRPKWLWLRIGALSAVGIVLLVLAASQS